MGFLMVAWDFVPEPPHADGPFFLWKLLIDRQHQGKGYGKQAVEQVIELIRANGGTELITSYVKGEGDPSGFYAKLGFSLRGDQPADWLRPCAALRWAWAVLAQRTCRRAGRGPRHDDRCRSA